jgi:5'-3' exonuclease
MGIKYLNKYLQSNCSDSIKQISLHELSGKKIVIDTSIYLYRFLGENALLENFYLMISIFREYNIIPLFVFDGKPPKEKSELLKQRRDVKRAAETKYNDLKDKIDDIGEDVSEHEKKRFDETLSTLKKEFIRVHHTDIENVKNLIQSYGVSYIDAPGEADKLCAKMVCKHKAYACLSEDMDLFVYGCNRVLRYLSLLKKKVIMYELKGILQEIKLSFTEFQHICVVSGTDYNTDTVDNGTSNRVNTNLSQTLKYFKKYQANVAKCLPKPDFYTWLEQNTKYVDNVASLYSILDLFDLKNMPEYKNYENLKIINGPCSRTNLRHIMEKEDFVFVE